MSPTAIGALVFACTFGGTLAGMWLRRVLPEHHFSGESKDTVKIGIGLIATMTALVLGLVTASAKSSFDVLDTAVKQTSADVLALDRVLARYGPETRDIREALREVVGRRLEASWPEESPRPGQAEPLDAPQHAEHLMDRIRALSPQNGDQRWFQARAADLGESMLNERWVVVSRMGPSIPVAFLVVLIFWLTITFASFGLFAPRNGTVIAVLFVCALCVSSAIFLILEMDSPFAGVIRISPDPVRFAYSRINQ